MTPSLLQAPPSLDHQLTELWKSSVMLRAQIKDLSLPAKIVKRLDSKLNDVQYILAEQLADARARGV